MLVGWLSEKHSYVWHILYETDLHKYNTGMSSIYHWYILLG
jgi:hypothetical protein